MTLHLEPGQVLREIELTKHLSISRTPLREALIRLSSMYLIDIVPQSGTYITLIDPDVIEEAIFLRLQVEPAMSEQSCSMITDTALVQKEDNNAMQHRLLDSGRMESLYLQDNAIHKIIYQACMAEKTIKAVEGICGQYNIMRALSLYHHTTKIAVQDHIKIFEAIKERNGAKARKIMAEHIKRQSKEYLIIQTKFPHFFKP
jgi:DNA-binding GntR family transcriptional regulator